MFQLKLTRDLIFFDLETTGVDIEKDRIVQIAAIKYTHQANQAGAWSADKIKKLNIILNPEISIPKEASDIHGITSAKVRNKKTFEQIAIKLYNFFKDCDLAGYNHYSFDIPILQRHFKNALNRTLPLEDKNIIDVFVLYKKLLPHTLAGAFKCYTSKNFVDAHNALRDTEATVEVLRNMLWKHTELNGCITDVSKFCLDIINEPTKVMLKNNKLILTFGKYSGKHISDVPIDYIKWAINNNVFNKIEKQLIKKYHDKR